MVSLDEHAPTSCDAEIGKIRRDVDDNSDAWRFDAAYLSQIANAAGAPSLCSLTMIATSE
jgi:hypothetical protein